MRGDNSRTPHDPRNYYFRVRYQQGRVHLDTDWNEAHEEGPAAPTQKERWRMAALLAAGSAALLIA